MSIRKKLLICLFLVVYLPILLVIEVLLFNAGQETEKLKAEVLSAFADLKADKIDGFFKERVSDLVSAQSYKNIRNNLSVLVRLSKERNHPDFLAAKESLDRQLRPFQKAKPINVVELISPEGLVVYASDQQHSIEEVGYPFHDPGGTILSNSRHDPYISNVPHYSGAGTAYDTFVSGPVHDYDGTFSGFIVFELDMVPLIDLVKDRTGLGQTGESLFAMQTGDQIFFLTVLRYNTAVARVESVRVGGEKAIAMQRALQGDRGVGLGRDYRGEEVLAAWCYIPGPRWGLVTKIDKDEAFASIPAGRRMAAIISLITLAFVTVVIFWITRAITAPLLLLRDGTRQIGAGDLNRRLQIHSKDEVGGLARDFNVMADKLAEARDTLESKVVERTHELEKSQKKVLVSLQEAEEQKCRAEEALDRLVQSSTELKILNRAIEQSPNGVIITDAGGAIQYANSKVAEISGYSRTEMLGQTPKIFNSGTHPPEFFAHLWETIKSGRDWHGEIVNKKKNGETFWVKASIAPILDDCGEITHFVAVKEDITEKRQVEMDLKARLEDLAGARSSLLNMMEDLKDERHRAEEATKAKSDFLANMSHEIRTPMNAIIGMIHLALQTDLTPQQQDYLNKVQSSANALLGIINDILDFSKVEAGKLEIESAAFQLDEVMKNVSNVISQEAEGKGLEVIFLTPQSVPLSLVGDSLRLSQVLINLANNAVKFTASGEVTVSVELEKKEADKVRLRFCVQDTGIGMTKEQAGRLFQPFSQADTSTTRKFGGTGLGLSISQKLVEVMGGELIVNSVRGEGSTFCFSLVLGLQTTQKREKRSIPETLSDMRAIVVDDQNVARKFFQDMLASFKLKVTSVGSGEDCIAELKKASVEGVPYDLVIMDYFMPNLSGFETSVQIKNDESLVKIPAIIMVTAYGSKELRPQVEKLGLEGFLKKPVSSSTMLNTIMQVFSLEIDYSATAADSSKLERLVGIRNARVLLAEDNEINQQVAREILEQGGLIVEVASDGREALAMFEENQYDAILMDIQMPVMDGMAATKEIRNTEAQRHKGTRTKRGIPIIAMTAHALTGDREKSIAAGMDDHLTKPIDPDELFGVLLKWIKPGEREIPKRLAEKSAEEARPAKEMTLHNLPGIDIQNGLARVGGNEELYRSLLVKFYKEYQGAVMQIKEALKKDDQELAARLAHTIKGLAGNLGARDLQEVAAGGEAAITSGNLEGIDGLLDNLELTLMAVMSGLNDFVAEVEEKAARKVEREAGKISFLSELLRELAPHVQKKKPKQCKDILARIDGFGWPAEYSGEIAELGRLIGKYKFKDVESILTALVEKLKQEDEI